MEIRVPFYFKHLPEEPMADYLYVLAQDPGHLTCTLLQSHRNDVGAGQASTNHHHCLFPLTYSRWAWDSTASNT